MLNVFTFQNRLFFLFLCCLIWPAYAYQDPNSIRKSIEEYLLVQIKGFSGHTSFSIGPIDAQNNLSPCPALEVSTPPGARSWGRTNVQVRCKMANGWTLYVPVHIRIFNDYLLTSKALAQGHLIAESDLAKTTGDLSELPNGVLTQASQAIGKTTTLPIAAGHPLRADVLRQAFVIQQGQNIKVISKGPGFQVTAGDGRALNNAVEGQVVQVRMPNGQTLSGLARLGGLAEISY